MERSLTLNFYPIITKPEFGDSSSDLRYGIYLICFVIVWKDAGSYYT